MERYNGHVRPVVIHRLFISVHGVHAFVLIEALESAKKNLFEIREILANETFRNSGERNKQCIGKRKLFIPIHLRI